MAKIYGWLERAQLENIAGDSSANLTGQIWMNTSSSLAKIYTGSAVKEILFSDTTQNFTTTGDVRLKSGSFYIALKPNASMAGNIQLVMPVDHGTNGFFLRTDGSGNTSWSSALGGGDVVGPASATDNAVARYDGTSGKLLQNSTMTISDAGQIDFSDISSAAASIIANKFSWASFTPSFVGMDSQSVNECKYIRIGHIVYFYMSVELDPTAAAATLSFVVPASNSTASSASVVCGSGIAGTNKPVYVTTNGGFPSLLQVSTTDNSNFSTSNFTLSIFGFYAA